MVVADISANLSIVEANFVLLFWFDFDNLDTQGLVLLRMNTVQTQGDPISF